MTATTTARRRRGNPSDRERQQRLRDRRKAEGWRRATVWLSPEQAARLETLGGDNWLGRTVKRLLGDVLSDTGKRTPTPAARFAVPEPAPVVSDTGPAPHPDNAPGRAAFLPPGDKAALMRRAMRLPRPLEPWERNRSFSAPPRRTEIPVTPNQPDRSPL